MMDEYAMYRESATSHYVTRTVFFDNEELVDYSMNLRDKDGGHTGEHANGNEHLAIWHPTASG